MAFTETITAFQLYENATDYYGIADIQLPELNQITEEIDGAGVAGKYTSVIIGHLEAMKMTLNMRNPTAIAYQLFTPEEHQLDLRANMQERDHVKGVHNVAVKHVIKARPLNLKPGKVGMYTTGDASVEYAVDYFATYIDGKEVLVADPFNYIYRVNGKDYLEDVRKNLGKA